MNYLQNAFNTLDTYAQEILNVKHNLDDNFSRAIEYILQCKGRVVVAGIGKSGLVGTKMVATFASTGTPSFFLHPTEAFHGDLGMLKPEDVVILISNSGETDDVNKLIPSLKSFGNIIIAMTGNLESTLAKHADVVLNIHVTREACPNNLAPTTSSLITMALGDALAVALIQARNFKPDDFARFHPGGNLGRKLLCKVQDVMQTKLPVVDAELGFLDCLTIMNQGRMGIAIVLEQNQLIGVVTDGDIRRTLAKTGNNSLNLSVKDFMTKTPKTIHETAYLSEAEQLLKEYKIHSLIVVNDQHKVVGLVEFTSEILTR